MADDDWFASMDDEPAQETAAAPPAAGGPAEGGAPAAGGEAPTEAGGEGGEAPTEAAGEEEYLDPDKLLLFKHWIRPKFLQYKYLYDYRHNYYNDVIEYLDKKCRGIKADIPRPQTWAERALRTYNSKIDKIENYRKEYEARMNVKKAKTTRRSTFISYHSKEYMTRRYTTVGNM